MTLFEISTEGAANLRAGLAQAREGLDISYFVNKRPAFRVDESGIAHVWVYGPLMQDAAPVYKDLGCTDYADLTAELSTPGIKGILLHVSSPGGVVSGCIEVAELVANASVPVVAYVHACACSAAYKIACGADYLVSSPSATVGNIGTILVWADTSAFMAGMGVTLNAITNEGATLKSTGHLDSLTEEQIAFLQSGIDSAGADFKAHVLSNRPGISSEVWSAGWWSGSKAQSLGLCDELGTEAIAMERLHELISIFDTLAE